MIWHVQDSEKNLCMLMAAIEKDVGWVQFWMQWVTTLCRQAERKQARTQTTERTKEHAWVFNGGIQSAQGNKKNHLSPSLLVWWLLAVFFFSKTYSEVWWPSQRTQFCLISPSDVVVALWLLEERKLFFEMDHLRWQYHWKYGSIVLMQCILFC